MSYGRVGSTPIPGTIENPNNLINSLLGFFGFRNCTISVLLSYFSDWLKII